MGMQTVLLRLPPEVKQNDVNASYVISCLYYINVTYL